MMMMMMMMRVCCYHLMVNKDVIRCLCTCRIMPIQCGGRPKIDPCTHRQTHLQTLDFIY